MLRVARSNARSVRCRVHFTTGDACSLDEPDDSFDAARSERRSSGSRTPQPRSPRWCGWCTPAAASR
jgi:hypothetical protein